MNVNVNVNINGDVNVNENVDVNVKENVNVDVKINANDVSLQPGPTQPRTFELPQAPGRTTRRPHASVRASASACKMPACNNVNGMPACTRHDAADETLLTPATGKLSVDLIANVDGKKDGKVAGDLQICAHEISCVEAGPLGGFQVGLKGLIEPPFERGGVQNAGFETPFPLKGEF